METTEPTSAEGQPEVGTETTPAPGPEEAAGQSGEGTTQEGPQEDTFFDPRSIQDKPELMAAYKNMQRNFSKKMEEIKSSRQKIQAYDAFYQDPLGQIQALASQMGYQLTRAEAAQLQQQQQKQDWEPKDWNEVLTKAEERAYSRIKQEFAPVMNQVKSLRENNMERFLDDNCPDWRVYEDKMMDKLSKHPSLVNDPESLYRMSVPPEVLESRATQAALKKLQTKAEGSKTSGTSTHKAKPGMPDKKMTFDEAVAFAKQKLASEGIRPPG